MICFDLGASIDWTAVSSIATAIMAIATFITIYYNRKQIKEIQREWDESNRAILEISIIATDTMYVLKIQNIGNQTASHICVKIDDTFLNAMLLEDAKKILKDLSAQKKILLPHASLYYGLSPLLFTEEFKTTNHSYQQKEIFTNVKSLLKTPLHIIVEYNNHKIDKTFTINDYVDSFIIYEPIETSLMQISNSLNSIKKSLLSKGNRVTGE